MRINIEPVRHSFGERRAWQVVFSWPSKQAWFETKNAALKFAKELTDERRDISMPGEKATIHHYTRKDAIIFNGKILGHKYAEKYPLHKT